MGEAKFDIIRDQPGMPLLIKDVGHNSGCPTVTNDAENVVRKLKDRLAGRQLYYIDSGGQPDEIIIDDNGKFVGFESI